MLEISVAGFIMARQCERGVLPVLAFCHIAKTTHENVSNNFVMEQHFSKKKRNITRLVTFWQMKSWSYQHPALLMSVSHCLILFSFSLDNLVRICCNAMVCLSKCKPRKRRYVHRFDGFNVYFFHSLFQHFSLLFFDAV